VPTLVYPEGLAKGDDTSMGNEMVQNSGLMQGKRGVILGVANSRSIAWGNARRAGHRARKSR